MEIDEYTRLSLGDKADILWKKGLFIENYCDKNVTINLYFIFNFFVEVVVIHNTFRIKEITAFEKGPRFEKYLESISLRSLLSNV
jgi:hypothetical protein